MNNQLEHYDFSKIPFDKIVHLGQRSLLNKDLFTVSWILGRFCNYNCSYCWPYASSRKKDHRPYSLITENIDEIKKQARERGFNSFHFSFSGGEPTFHPDYLKIIKYYAEDSKNSNFQSCHMTTNLSRNKEWFDKYIEATQDLDRVSITASWHREFSKKEDFINKLVYLQENGVHVTINMVMVPQWFDSLWAEAEYFQSFGINVTLKPQSDKTASFVVKDYTEQQLKRLYNGLPQRDFTNHYHKVKKEKKEEKPLVPRVMQVELTDEAGNKWYLDQAERFNSFNFNKFCGWECSSGYRSIIIREPDGAIKRSYSCHDEPLGFLDKGFKLFDGPKICKTPSCVSSADSKIPKRKFGVSYPLCRSIRESEKNWREKVFAIFRKKI